MSFWFKLSTEFRKELRLLLIVVVASLLVISAIWHSYGKKIHVVDEKIKDVTNDKR